MCKLQVLNPLFLFTSTDGPVKAQNFLCCWYCHTKSLKNFILQLAVTVYYKIVIRKY